MNPAAEVQTCAVCASNMIPTFSAKLLGRHTVTYYFCGACGFLRTETPFWLEDAYSEAIAGADTGLVMRNFHIAKQLSSVLWLFFDRNAKFLDVSGGTGMLVRLMRDVGFDFYWQDPYCQNIHARGFEYSSAVGNCQVVTAFEVLEHIHTPIQFVSDALKKSGADTFIFTTETFKGNPAAPSDWWYYALETGQHIAFYQKRSLAMIASALGMQFYSHGGLHMFTRRNITNAAWRLATGRMYRLLYPVVRRLMHSKTMEDHRYMLEASMQQLRAADGARREQ